jgi:hypothetical protein
MSAPVRRQLLRKRALPDAGGESLFFVIPSSDRRYPPTFFRPGEVPEFGGESAWFEMQRIKGRWLLLRQVDETGARRHRISQYTPDCATLWLRGES